jgi:S-adenosylmethionine/arginine decarboxylase-like enzyme
MAKYWGYHMMIDAAGCDVTKITDGDLIKDFARVLVERIDMVAFGDPVAVHFAQHDPGKAGYTLAQMIETSMISAHFVDATGEAYLDVFSCKTFDQDVVRATFEEYFHPTSARVSFLTRQA